MIRCMQPWKNGSDIGNALVSGAITPASKILVK